VIFSFVIDITPDIIQSPIPSSFVVCSVLCVPTYCTVSCNCNAPLANPFQLISTQAPYDSRSLTTLSLLLWLRKTTGTVYFNLDSPLILSFLGWKRGERIYIYQCRHSYGINKLRRNDMSKQKAGANRSPLNPRTSSSPHPTDKENLYMETSRSSNS